MLRKLIDYKKLDHQLAALLIETYPYGYGDEDILIFKNAHGEFVEAVEIKSDDTIYLVKISKSLANFISNFDDNIEKELEEKAAPVLEEADAPDFGSAFNTDQESEDDADFD